MAAPLTIPPSGSWSVVDGSWSTFTLQLGSGPGLAAVNVDISTSSSINYAVDGGIGSSNNSQVIASRAGVFNPGNSTTWQDVSKPYSFYSIAVDSWLPGYEYILAHFGFDNITTGTAGGGGPSLGRQVIATFQDPRYWRGLFGILPFTNYLTNFTNPYPSFLQNLKTADIVPSLSWGYTAGAIYQENGIFGSLTLGGYDQSRFQPGGQSFPMNPDSSHFLTVGLDRISVSGNDLSLENALSSPINVSLDSTLPFVWLPEDACEALASTFNLQYNESANLYFISDTINDGLPAGYSPKLDFFLSSPGSSETSEFKIRLPYQAFNQSASMPFANQTSDNFLYFPLKRASSPYQYTLGRTFFQEAYIVADFERKNFTVAQAYSGMGTRQNLQAIYPPSTPTLIPQPPPQPGSNTGAIVGGVVGGVLGLACIAGIVLFLWRRKKNRRRRSLDSAEKPPGYEHDHNAGELHGDLPKRPGELEAGSGIATPNQEYLSPPASPDPEGTPSPQQETALMEMWAPDVTHELVGDSPDLAPLPAEAPTAAKSKKRPSRRHKSHRSYPSVQSVVSGETDADDEESELERPTLHERTVSEETTASLASSKNYMPVSPASIKMVTHRNKAGRHRSDVSSESEVSGPETPERIRHVSSIMATDGLLAQDLQEGQSKAP